MLVEDVLDFRREDVLATRDDHVVVATFDVEAAVLADPPDVTDRREVAESGLVLSAGVTLEGHSAACEDSPDRAGLDILVVLVNDSNRNARQHLSRSRR